MRSFRWVWAGLLIPLSVLGEEYVPATITHAFSDMADADENGIADSLEQYLTTSGISIPVGYDPSTSDLDGDSTTDFFEWALGTDPLSANTAFGLSPNSFTNSSGGMTVEMQLPDWFGGYAEIYGRGSLLTGYWNVLDDWIPTFGTNQLSWEDIARENDNTYFYTIFDATMDYDSDGLSDAMEHYIMETDPEVFDESDFDHDNLQDYWEYKLFKTYAQHGTNDFDGDGLLNQEELVFLEAANGGPSVTFYSDPTLYDTDGGGINDGFETLNPEYGLDPLNRLDDRADLDDDGLNNYVESMFGTELNNPDTDGDLVSDGAEVQWGTNPLVANNWDWDSDTDGDGMTLEVEYAARSNPFDAQSIGDINSIVEVNVELGSAADFYGYPYALTLISRDHIAQSLAESDFYQVSETLHLRKGVAYHFELERLVPDNWVCTIREKSYIADLVAGITNGVSLIINDPNEVLGEHPDDESLDALLENNSATGSVCVAETKYVYIGFGDGSSTTSRDKLEDYLDSIGAEHGATSDVYVYENVSLTNRVEIRIVPMSEFSEALSKEDAYVVFDGHSNYGIGLAFDNQYVDFDDFLNVGDPRTGICWEGIKSQQPFLIFDESTIASNPTNYGTRSGWQRFSNDAWTNGTEVVQEVSETPPNNVFSTIHGEGEDRFHYINGDSPYLIMNTGPSDLPDLNYKWLMLHTCQSSIYYSDSFDQGILFTTVNSAYAGDSGVKLFVQAVIENRAPGQLLWMLNNILEDYGDEEGKTVFEALLTEESE